MRLKIEIGDRIFGNKYFILSFIIMAYIIVLLYSETTSPVYNIECDDSAVFKMMGRVLLNGGVPYVDYFDHKGPYIYLIDALGEYISPIWGLFAIQVGWLFITLVLWYKIALQFVRPTFAFVVLLLSVFFFLDYYECGNLIEEWALLPSSLCLYLSIDYLLHHHESFHPLWKSLVYGLCFGFIFFLRPNDAVIQCGGVMLGIFIYVFFRQKQYKNAILNAFAFTLGFLIIIAPWIVYFAVHHALNYLYFGLLGFNLGYSGGVIGNIFNVYITCKLLIICSAPLLMVSQAQKKELLWLLIPVDILILLFFGRNYYPHYYMSLIPFVYLLAFALLFNLGLRFMTLTGIIMLLLNPTNHTGMHRGFGSIERLVHHSYVFDPSRFESQWRKLKNENLDRIFDIIPLQERDSVWNYSDEFSVMFYHCGIIAQNPVPPVIAYKKELFPDEQLDALKISLYKPLWIYIQNSPAYLFPTDSAFIADNYCVANQSKSSMFILMRRKDN